MTMIMFLDFEYILTNQKSNNCFGWEEGKGARGYKQRKVLCEFATAITSRLSGVAAFLTGKVKSDSAKAKAWWNTIEFDWF